MTIALAFLFITAAELPSHYQRLLEAGSAKVAARLNAEPNADLKSLEATPGWRHFPYAILAPAVLYHRQPANTRMRDLAIRIGDLLARESERGVYEPRGDSDWDDYMWLEAWRLLGPAALGEGRRTRWRREIEKNIGLLEEDARDRLDFPWYNSPYTGTSPNHYALWAANLYLGGKLFGNPRWESLGARILKRFATVEQTIDGYWGEHSRNGPTIGYNHLTLSALAVYYEHSRDPVILPALRRALDFHKHFTFLDGTPVDVVNDRNRHWNVSAWSQFAFTHFTDGRGYAAFLGGFFKPESIAIDALGRLAQDALYFHAGPSVPPPQWQPAYSYRLQQAPAGVRKSGPWQWALSGVIDTQAPNSQFYLDRQSHMSIYHREAGLIITGANSKRQPELATFSEIINGALIHLPLSSRLQMGEKGDRLSLGYNTFFTDLYVTPSTDALSWRFSISGRGRPGPDTRLNLQLCLKSGEALVTESGQRVQLGVEPVELAPDQLGRRIQHHGWTLELPAGATLAWPVYPHNPYTNAPETNIDFAVARLSIPITLKPRPGKYIRAHELELPFRLRVP